jgi:hypothetical protein
MTEYNDFTNLKMFEDIKGHIEYGELGLLKCKNFLNVDKNLNHFYMIFNNIKKIQSSINADGIINKINLSNYLDTKYVGNIDSQTLRLELIDFLVSPVKNYSLNTVIYSELFFQVIINTSINFIGDIFEKKIQKKNIYVLNEINSTIFESIVDYYFTPDLEKLLTKFNDYDIFKTNEFSIPNFDKKGFKKYQKILPIIEKNIIGKKDSYILYDSEKNITDIFPNLQTYLNTLFSINDFKELINIRTITTDSNEVGRFKNFIRSYLIDGGTSNIDIFLSNLFNFNTDHINQIKSKLRLLDDFGKKIKTNLFLFDTKSNSLDQFKKKFLNKEEIIKICQGGVDSFFRKIKGEEIKIPGIKQEDYCNIDNKKFDDEIILEILKSKKPFEICENQMHNLASYPLNIGYFYIMDGYYLTKKDVNFYLDTFVKNLNDEKSCFNPSMLKLLNYFSDYKINIIEKINEHNFKYWMSMSNDDYLDFCLNTDIINLIDKNRTIFNFDLAIRKNIIFYLEDGEYSLVCLNKAADNYKILFDGTENLMVFLNNKKNTD